MSEFWERLLIAAAMIAVAGIAARLVDRRIARRDLAPETVTRYRVLRRSIWTAIVFVGVLSALLVIPQVRAVAGGILASSAVIGLVIGFASQRTIGNFVAGILIAFTQPLRLGDEVEVQGVRGIVEEIGLTYTWIRTRDNDRLVVPNEKLASDTILNSTIRSAAKFAEVTVQVPATADLRQLVQSLRAEVPGERDEVFVSSLEGSPTLTLRAWTESEVAAERLEHDLRLRVHDRLRGLGTAA
jgi:small-conductance mechanosensitive channel